MKTSFFNFEVEPSNFVEDIFIINGEIPLKDLNNNIVLIANTQHEHIKRFLEKERDFVYVFNDEKSMYKFKELLLGSKEYMDEGFNLNELRCFYNSTKNYIRVLKYFYGFKEMIKEDRAIFFVNNEDVIKTMERIDKGDFVWIIRDKSVDSDIEGFHKHWLDETSKSDSLVIK